MTAGVDAARKRAAVETYVRHRAALRRTARRYSICEDDAEDALQRGLEILLRKAPSEDPRELIRWTQTVVKHEALAVRRERERILSGPAAIATEPGKEDWVALLPADGDGPPELAERREAVARSREALQSLKPQELRALTLLAEGYSYAEIGEITNYSATKINRCLAEGRERFRRLVSRSEGGQRCAEMAPLISAFCDGEAGDDDVATLREHLRACQHCRSTLRAYRAAPGAAAALAPTLPASRGLFDRAHDAVTGLLGRVGGGGSSSDSALSQLAAAGGTRGAGMAALAKTMAICIGAVGGAACVATGVVATPLVADADQAKPAKVERQFKPLAETGPTERSIEYEPAPPPSPTPQETATTPHEAPPPAPTPTPVESTTPEAASGAVEYTPSAPPAAQPASSSGASSGSAAGEFGP
ncbi:MAG: sigma-70 family RNA polymerase sigma factor [Solirubrobacterales bacterium]|nr:sigma-70 family RNA polymerase sigma factor [Solirubrobacterales bacterium]